MSIVRGFVGLGSRLAKPGVVLDGVPIDRRAALICRGKASLPRMGDVASARKQSSQGLRVMQKSARGTKSAELARGDAALRVHAFWPSAKADGPVPLVLYLHGGGLVVGNYMMNARALRRLVRATGALVVTAE